MSIFFKQQKKYFQSITELITVYRILLWKIWIFAPKMKKCVYFSWFSSTVQYNRREIVALCMTYKIFRVGTLRESPFAKIQFWYKNIELSRWRLVKLKLLRFHLLKVTLTHHICSSQLLCDLLKGIISLKLSVQKRKNEFRHIFFNANLSLLHSSLFPDS